MSYTEPKQQNENVKRINLDEVVEDEFNLSKKKPKMNDSDTSKDTSETKKRINLNEVM